MTMVASLTEPVYASDISPTAQVRSTDDSFVIDAQVPGFLVEDLQVEVVDRFLHVQGDAPPRRELLRPKFEFWFALPPLADEDSVEAVFEDGVVTIQAQLRPGRGPRTIEIATRS